MDRKNGVVSLEFLKDVIRHHRKFTAFQKTVAFSSFLVVLILIFRNVWIMVLALSFCGCLYLSYIACQYIVEYRSYFPSEVALVFLEKIEKLFENLHNDEPAKVEGATNSDVTEPAIKAQETKNVESDEFYDASEELNLDAESQSTFYVELCGEHSFEGHISKQENQNSESTRQKYSEYISTNCPQNVQDEIERLIMLIDRDFIKSWYYLFSKHFESVEDADNLLHGILVSILQRILGVDIRTVAKVLMCMFSNHVKRCKEARMMYKVQSKRRRRSSAKSENVNLSPKLSPMILKSLEECFASKVDFHTALKSSDIEYMYLNSLVELLILKLMPDHLNDSKGLVCALREILSCNILSSVMNLVCDPTFLHERIIKITSDEDVGGDLVDSPVLTESNIEEVTLVYPKVEQEHFNVEADSKECATSKVEDKIDSEIQYTERRKSSFLDDTKLHFVSRGMCNECNRLCSKDRDKIEPHPHTCSLGKEPCFLDVKQHDIDRLSASSGEGSPVFKFYISDIDTAEDNPSQHSNFHDIPNDTEIDDSPHIVPNKVILKKVPSKLEKTDQGQHVLSKSWPVESDKSSLTESIKSEHLSQSSSLSESVRSEHLSQSVKSDIKLTQGVIRPKNNPPRTDCTSENIPDHSKHTDDTSEPVQNKQTVSNSKETQEQRFLPSFGGSLFGFTFPQFGNKPLKEKNRSSSNLEEMGDSESEDFSNIRRSKSSTEFRPDEYPTEVPLPFQDIRIEKTETAKEAGSLNPYTLYVIRVCVFSSRKQVRVMNSRTPPYTPLLHVYIVKLGFTGVYFFSYFCSKT